MDEARRRQTDRPHLRPLERRVLSMRAEGLSVEEIGRRTRRSAAHVSRVIAWTEIPRSAPAPQRNPRAIEARVLALRARGETHAQIGERFRRSARFIRQVEGLAHFKMSLDLLS